MTTNKDLNYEVTWIPVKNLSVVWRKSQRPYNEKWAKKIADEFDPDLFEPVSVTRPNGAGVYHLIEGQHRKGAIEMLYGPNETVPCRIISDADPARAAKIWRGINKSRKAIRPITDFLVAVEAKETLECTILGIVRRSGYRIIETGRGDNAISAVASLRKVFNLYGEKVLTETLEMTRHLWGSDPNGVKSQILTGMGMFINEFHGYVEANHLRRVIHGQYKTPFKFIEAVRLEADRSSETMDIAMSELLRMKYNKGRPEHKRLKRRKDDK